MNKYEWPDDFWAEFVERYWERDPTSFKCPAQSPFIELNELFDVVTSMPSRVKSDRFWIAKKTPSRSLQDFVRGSLTLLGPQKSDVDFNGYFTRLKRHTTGINIHNLDKAKPILWDRVQGFVDNLSDVSGKPSAKNWDLDTFFGTYHATPFGIHKDSASVFAFGLMGKRTYCTWNLDYFNRGDEALYTPDLDKIRPHLDNAEIFTLNAGEIFYWPSNRWHLAMSNGAPSVVAQISAYFETVHCGIKV